MQDDFQKIQQIKRRWQQEGKSVQHKKVHLKLEVPYEESSDFQLPDVFITTRPPPTTKTFTANRKERKFQAYDFSPELCQPQMMSRQDRKRQIDEMESSYNKFKNICNIQVTDSDAVRSPVVDNKYQNEFINVDGVRYPMQLFMINTNRQRLMNEAMQRQPVKRVEISQDEAIREQKRLKHKEFRSHSFMSNAYYSMVSANKTCRARLRNIIKREFPAQSRFQQI